MFDIFSNSIFPTTAPSFLLCFPPPDNFACLVVLRMAYPTLCPPRNRDLNAREINSKWGLFPLRASTKFGPEEFGTTQEKKTVGAT